MTESGDPGATVHRLAVLLHAGLTPARAWQHLARAGDGDAIAVVGEAGDAASAPDLIAAIAARGEAWAQVARVWRVAATVGAPLAESLRAIAEALRDAEQARDDVRVALAEPAATARLIAWLPLVAIVLVALLGFDVLSVVTQPLGLACAGAGVALMLLARRWTRRLVTGAQPSPQIPGLACDIMAIALSGGVSIPRALAVVADADGDDDGDAGGDAASSPVAAAPEVADALELSHASGAPAVELLRAAAVDARRRARTAGRTRAAQLSSALLLPLGVCTLPSFLLLGVVPMMLSVLSATPLTL